MYAGIDWSGTPDIRKGVQEPDLYVACCVVMPDIDEANRFLDELRKRRHQAFDYEFKGYHSTEESQKELIEYVLEVGKASTVIVGKRAVESSVGVEIFAHPDKLAIATGRMILKKALGESEIRTVWCDEELSKEKQKRFNTAIHKDAKSLCRKSPKIRHDASHKSNMIQLADTVAYMIQRDALGRVKLDRLKRIVKKLKDTGAVECYNTEDDLRPYLQF